MKVLLLNNCYTTTSLQLHCNVTATSLQRHCNVAAIDTVTDILTPKELELEWPSFVIIGITSIEKKTDIDIVTDTATSLPLKLTLPLKLHYH